MKQTGKTNSALAVLAYVSGWRQADDGTWFKPGFAGSQPSPAAALDAEEAKRRGRITT